MKVLLDENIPHKLRFQLAGHEVYTVAHQGWLTIRNGLLLAEAERSGFEVLVTGDRNFSYQQNMKGRRIGLVVLSNHRWARLKTKAAIVAAAIQESSAGSFIEVQI